MSQVLAAALAKLLASAGRVAASSFTTAQRRALEELARKTGALRICTEGCGIVFQTVHPEMLAAHLKNLRPQHAAELDPSLPQRATNIAHSRDSKAGDSRHALHYLLVKAIGPGVCWQNALSQFDLSQVTTVAGVGALALTENDAWHSVKPLWLVENQALFDRLDWLPSDADGTVAYYAGQLPNRLLQWLATRPRVPEVVLFADYDGVGLLNYARLREQCAAPCSFWLMPDWQQRLSQYGSNAIWQNTHSEFQTALARLEAMGMDEELAALCRALSREGLALEHEAVWLAAS